jgi:hypothetical protein
MGTKLGKDLINFLSPYPADIKELALRLRDFMRKLYPKSNELIYDNYNSLVIGFSTTEKTGDAFCSIALYSEHINFGFLRGSELPDPLNKLNGKGSLYRYISLSSEKEFPVNYMKKILKSAYINSLSRLQKSKIETTCTTIVKSISKKKRRPPFVPN